MTTLIVAASVAVLFVAVIVGVVLWLGALSYRETREVGETIRRKGGVRDLKPDDTVDEVKEEDEA